MYCQQCELQLTIQNPNEGVKIYLPSLKVIIFLVTLQLENPHILPNFQYSCFIILDFKSFCCLCPGCQHVRKSANRHQVNDFFFLLHCFMNSLRILNLRFCFTSLNQERSYGWIGYVPQENNPRQLRRPPSVEKPRPVPSPHPISVTPVVLPQSHVQLHIATSRNKSRRKETVTIKGHLSSVALANYLPPPHRRSIVVDSDHSNLLSAPSSLRACADIPSVTT